MSTKAHGLNGVKTVDIKKKTGSSGQKVTERPGEFRMSRTWDHGELQSAPLLERKPKM